MNDKKLKKLFLLEDKLKDWIKDHVWKWSFILIISGILISLLQSYLLESSRRTTFISMFFYVIFLLLVESFVRNNEDF